MKSKSKAAKTVGMVSFIGAFKVLCISFDPTLAFLLSLVALAAIRHI